MAEALKTTASPRCYLCGQPGRVLFAELPDRLFSAPGEWTLRECSACGLVWLDPAPDPAELASVQADYYTHAAGDAGVAPTGGSALRRALRGQVLRSLGYPPGALGDPATAPAAVRLLARVPLVREILAGEAGYLPAAPGATLLDVGCGSGDFLVRMRMLGWSVAGVEPDPVAAAIAVERLGGDVHAGDLSGGCFEPGSFDAITLNHVIEHLPDPAGTLAACRRLLRPGGRIVVTTPNAGSLGRRRFGRAWLHWDPPRHRFVFTPATLRQCVQRAGLAVAELRTLSRAARWSWTASRAIARGRAIDGWSPSAANQNGVGAVTFALAEHVACAVAEVGEEIRLVAGRVER